MNIVFINIIIWVMHETLSGVFACLSDSVPACLPCLHIPSLPASRVVSLVFVPFHEPPSLPITCSPLPLAYLPSLLVLSGDSYTPYPTCLLKPPRVPSLPLSQ